MRLVARLATSAIDVIEMDSHIMMNPMHSLLKISVAKSVEIGLYWDQVNPYKNLDEPESQGHTLYHPHPKNDSPA